MHKLVTGTIFAAALALCGGSVLAVDQVLVGHKLRILNPGGTPSARNKIVYLSRTVSMAIPTLGGPEDPRCVNNGGSGAGGVLSVRCEDSGQSATVTLPCAGWSVNSAGTLFMYKDRSGATCNMVILKEGVYIKVRCRGAAIQSYDLNGEQIDVDVLVRTGIPPGARWCTRFGPLMNCTRVKSGADGRGYLSRDCFAPPNISSCPASASGAFLNDIGGLF
jgi:hypothetical protein